MQDTETCMKQPSPTGFPQSSELVRAIQDRTQARILLGRAGSAYRTTTQLALRQDHAAALDAVRTEIDLSRDFDPGFIRRWGIFEVTTRAQHKTEYLLRPDLGRCLSQAARETIRQRCSANADLQVVIGDGLSVAAVKTQVPLLLAALAQGAQERGWQFGQPFLIRYCRVGVLNDIGEILKPEVGVLLIGERPGLATAESLSAYMGYQPRAGHTDAERNLISNIHARGVSPTAAVVRILRLVARLRQRQISGVDVKEELESQVEEGRSQRLPEA